MKRKLPEVEDLICTCYVFNSHEDFSVAEDLYTGFDSNFNLIILCKHTDYDEPDYNCSTYAIVDKDEAYRLAKRLKVSLCLLPKEIGAYMADWDEIDCPLPEDVRACFKDITECLIDEGCHLRILRKPSR